MSPTRMPIGRLEQYDPGVYSDEAGNYFTGNPTAGGSYDVNNLTFAGTNPLSFGIGNAPGQAAPAADLSTYNTTPTAGQLSTGYDAGGNLSYGAQPAAPATSSIGQESPGFAVSPFLPGGSPTVPASAQRLTPQQISPSTFKPTTYKAPTTPNPSLVSDVFNVGGGASENGYGGVTYAGFDPQNHQGAALGDPMNAKYALQQFLVDSGTDLSGNAVQIASQLNAKYGAAYGDPNFFTAIDGETIMMPDGQYVHAAPNGYGLGTGTFNPANSREVFWGSSGAGSDATPTGSSGTGTSTGTGKESPGYSVAGTSGSNPNGMLAMLTKLMAPQPTGPALPPGYGGPGPALTNGVNQVGQDPLNDLETSALAGILQNGGTPYGQNIEATLADLISRGGLSPSITNQLIGARDAEAGAFSGQLADARAALASRGLASVPGSPQGPEVTAIDRISEGLAPTYASAVSDIESHAIDTGNASVMQSLSMATGMSEQDTQAILGAIGTGTARTTALSNIALKSLEDNQQWNEFLANFGLQKDQVAEQLAQGRITSLVPLLQMFLQMAGASAQGFIGQ